MSGPEPGSPTKSSRRRPWSEQVQRQGAGALGVLRADRLDALAGVARDEQQRLGALQRPDGGLGDRRGAQHRQAVDAGRELPHRPGEVGLAAGEHEDHALPELGRPGLEAHQQLGVVGTGELGKDQAVRLVVADGEAARGAQRHVVELLRGGEHLDPGPVGDGGGALQDPRDRRDGDTRERGDRVDRRAGALPWRRCHGPALSVESAYIIGPRRVCTGERCRARGPAGRISPGPVRGGGGNVRWCGDDRASDGGCRHPIRASYGLCPTGLRCGHAFARNAEVRTSGSASLCHEAGSRAGCAGILLARGVRRTVGVRVREDSSHGRGVRRWWISRCSRRDSHWSIGAGSRRGDGLRWTSPVTLPRPSPGGG